MAADTQENILHTAGVLFYKFGIRSVSIDDICKELGMSKKTFYSYYKTKDELVENVLDKSVEQMKSMNMNLNKNNLRACLQRFAKQHEEDKTDVRRIPQLLHDLRKYYPGQFAEYQMKVFELQCSQIREALKLGIEDGLIRSSIDIELTTLLFAKLHADTVRDIEIMQEHGTDIKRFMHNSTEVLLRGILTPEGIEVLSNK